MKVKIIERPVAKFADLAVGDAFCFTSDGTDEVFMKINYIHINALDEEYNCVNLAYGNLDYAENYDTVYPLRDATITTS